MIRNHLGLLTLVVLAGCASTTPVDVSGSGSQLETRQIQTRQYDTLDKAMTMRSVIATLQDLGFIGALAAESGYADAARVQSETRSGFRVRRFTYPDYLPHVIQAVSGLERVKEILRRED